MTLLDDFPKSCGFCGRPRGDGTGFQVCFSVDNDGAEHKSAMCEDCIRVHIMNFAHANREKFEELVEEARNWKPEQSE